MTDRAISLVGARYKSYKNDGTVNSGGKIYFYEAGTTTLKDTYSDAEATTPNANPVVLDTRGEASVYGKGTYKIVEKDSDDNQLGAAQDGVLLPEITDDALGLLNDDTVSDMRSTLGLGTAALKDTGTSAGDVVVLDASGKLPAVDGSNLTNISAGSIALPYGYLSGFTLSRGGNTTIGITAGACRDSTDKANMSQDTAYTKTLTAWAVGTANGALESGLSLAPSTYYHVHAIYNATSKVSDFLISASATSPTFPSGYAYFRRLGSIKTDGSSHVTEFTQLGDEFLWLDPPMSISVSGVDNTAHDRVLDVPTGVQVRAMLNVTFANASNPASLYLSPKDVNDELPAGDTTAPLCQIVAPVANKRYGGGIIVIRTDTSATIRSRGSVANNSIDIVTLGWLDSRGRD